MARETKDVATTPRKAMSQTRRLRIFEKHGGKCVLCNQAIDGVRESWTIEHLRALGLGGPDTDDNCGPAHEHCRREKDKDDVSRIAKAKRAKARHLGLTVDGPKLQGQPFRPTKKSADRKAKAEGKIPVPAPRAMFERVET